jgi:hypothetical protein
LWSACADLGIFGLSFALPLTLVALARLLGSPNRDLPPWAFLACVVAVDVAHVYATGFRTYFDAAELRRHPLRYAGIPVLALALALLAAGHSLTALFRGLAYVAVFHFVRQQAGWVALYRRAAGDFSRRTRIIDNAAIYLATLYPLLEWHATPESRRFAWFMQGDFLAAPWLAEVLPLVRAAWLIALLAFVLGQLSKLYRERRLEAGKSLVVLGTALTWYVGIVACNGDFEFTVTNVLPHGIPYLALLYLYAQKRKAEQPGSFGARLLGGGLLSFSCVCLALALAEEALWDRLVWHDHPGLFGESPELPPLWARLCAAVLVLPQAVHYVLDGLLWRGRDSRERSAQREALGLRTVAGAE